MYKPLPDSLTVKASSIHGLGLFATEDIEKGTLLGITHVEYAGAENGWIRTPLGGFYNHADDPNAVKQRIDDMYWLTTIKDIKVGEEITVSYTFYRP